MAETSIAKTSIKVTTDATGAKAGLDQFGNDTRAAMNRVAQNTKAQADQIGREVEQSFHKTEKTLNKSFGKFAKKEGGFLGAIGGGVIGDLGFGAAAAGIVGVALAVKQLNKLFDESHETLKKWEKTIAGMGEARDRGLAHSAEWRAAMIDPLAKFTSLDKDILRLRQEKEDHVATVAAAEAKIKDVRGFTPGKVASRIGAWAGIVDDPRDIPRAIRDRSIVEIERIDKDLARLREDRSRIFDKEKDPAFVGLVNQATLALKDQAAAWGLTGEAAQRALFVAHGATEKMLKDYDAAAAKVRDLAEAERLSAIETERFFATRSTSPFSKEIRRIVRDMPLSDPRRVFDEKGSGRFGSIGSLLAMGVNAAGEALKPLTQKIDKARTDNAALIRGSSAEVDARNRFEQSGKMLEEQKKQSQLLRDVKDAIAATNAILQAGGLMPL